MRPLKPEVLAGATPASLALELSARDFQPIELREAEIHMQTELTAAPKATPFYEQLLRLPYLIWGVGLVSLAVTIACLAVGILLEAVGVTGSSTYIGWVCMETLTSFTACVILVVLLDHVTIRDEARWVEVTFEEAEHSGLVTAALRQLIEQLRSSIHIDRIICAKLVQNNTVLDPVWFAERDTDGGVDRACFAITNAHGAFVRKA